MLWSMRVHSLRPIAFVLGSLLAVPCLAQAAKPPPPPPMMAAPLPPPPPRYEIAAWGGYAINSDVNASATTLRIDDAVSFGLSIGARAPYGSLAQLKWFYSDPKVRLSGASSSNDFHVMSNYLLLCGEKGIRRGKVEPFFWGGLGTGIFSPSGFNVGGAHYSPDTTWRFAFGLGGGVKVWLNPKLGLRLGAEMLAPVLFDSSSFYVGTGGAGLAVSGGIPTVMGNFTVGLAFNPS